MEKTIEKEDTKKLTNSLSDSPIQIPKDAYRFIPDSEQIIKIDKSNLKNSMRKIFSTLKPNSFYQEYELKALSLFEEKYIKSNNSTMDITNNKSSNLPNVHLSKEDLMRFLQAVNWNVEMAYEYIIKHQEWRLVNLPVKYDKIIEEILNIGFIYIYGRDHFFRPIIVINVEVYMKHHDKYKFDDWSKSILYLLEYIKAKLFLHGQIEQWVTIFNMTNCSVLSIPDELKSFSKLMQENYRCRLNTLYVVGLSFIMRWALKLMTSLLEGSTKDKFKIIGNNKELLQYININQLETFYDGNGIEVDIQKINNKNVITHKTKDGITKSILKPGVFPPVFEEKEDHGCTSEVSRKQIVNEEKYMSMINNNEIYERDPHVILDEDLD